MKQTILCLKQCFLQYTLKRNETKCKIYINNISRKKKKKSEREKKKKKKKKRKKKTIIIFYNNIIIFKI